MKKTIQAIALITTMFTTSVSASSYEVQYVMASKKNGVPVQVLRAIALTESGITLSDDSYKPWPFTLNWRKKEYRFNTKEKACTELKKILKVSRAVDIGMTQLHWKYHDEFVGDACDYFDAEVAIPRTAVVLKKCYKNHKNWVLAAGCYHRPAGGELAKEYMKKFAKKLETITAK
ncbi:lytic transglycosylase [Vibrio europaeus]|uniref:lytic transglycosylase n=1 Tax=Vibrio europaeus TaxID=300876 RepID=UPI00233F460C|nr:lytic transglycosylase [Vibrio europaeus]MDC5870264.1 lytic transglycosylase [Vibrio europaeus]